MRACFWLDAGEDVGGGHIARAEALADALAARGWQSLFFANDVAAAERMTSGRFPLEVLSSGFADACRARRARLAVVDLPHTRPPSEKQWHGLTASGIPIMSFDSSDPDLRHSHLVVNAVAKARQFTRAGERGRALYGPRYAVLRAHKLGTPTVAPTRQPRTTVVVGFGASDPGRLTTHALEALKPLREQLAIEVLIGALASREHRSGIEAAAAAFPHVRVHTDVTDPYEVLESSHLGVMGFGNLFLEAATAGLPCVLWHPSKEHARVASQFLQHFDRPAALDGGEARQSGPEWLVGAVTALTSDPIQRRNLSRSGRSLLDGKGASRVAGEAVALRVG